MEQDYATFKSIADPRDDASLLNTLHEFRKRIIRIRKACQAAYERTQAEIKVMESKFKARQEHLSRIEERKRDATIELQAWKDWQADGGKIFPPY